MIGICLVLSVIYSVTSSKSNVVVVEKRFTSEKKINAFIITAKCYSERFNFTQINIEKAFPNLFQIHCFQSIPLDDSRIHTGDNILWKKLSSNLLGFIELWAYKIPELSTNEFDWSFIFEDDVDFVNATDVSLPNFNEPMKEFLNDRQIRMKDGFFYLGMCEPQYPRNESYLFKNSTNMLVVPKAYGFCLHASAITAKKAKLFWTEISSYRPNAQELSLDYQLRNYCERSKNLFYVFGTNFQCPPDSRHFGIAYQNRKRFISTVT